jgi:hypothetical protein
MVADQSLGVGCRQPFGLPSVGDRLRHQFVAPLKVGVWIGAYSEVNLHIELNGQQRYPRAGSQSYPSPAAEAVADGSTTVRFAPTQPDGVARGNWTQTDLGRP